MTTELTKAAQQALEPCPLTRAIQRINSTPYSLTKDECVEVLRGLREEIRALTQRPAAQTERDTGPRVLREVFAVCEDTMDKMAAESTEFSRGRAFEAKGISRAIGTWFQDEYCGRSHMGEPSLPAPQQATPEPVGEPSQFPPLPEGWPARFRCDSCDGNGESGELVSMGHFQPPERQTCPDCGGRGWTSEEPAFNAEHMREFAEAHARNTRPAPGVPEGFALVPMEPTPEMMDRACADHGYPGGNRWIYRDGYKSMLAAAQAKGGGECIS